MSVNEKMTAIADAIRGKTGKADALTLDQMAMEIEAIENGSGVDYLAQRLDGKLVSYESSEVTEIALSAFSDCTSLCYVSLPNATHIGGKAFLNCDNLEIALLPNAEEIHYGAFRNCDKLKEFVAPKLNAQRFDAETFDACESITKIDVGRVGAISGYRAIGGTKGLEALIFRQTDAIVNLTVATAFTGSSIESGTGFIYVPSALLEEYKNATNWSVYADQFRAIEGSEYE